MQPPSVKKKIRQIRKICGSKIISWFYVRRTSRPSSLLTRPSNPIPIIITDLTADISDAHNATNTIKFKWKYRTPQFPHHLPASVNIFDDPFARPFD